MTAPPASGRTAPPARLLTGAAGQEVHREHLPGVGDVSATVLDPDVDVAVVHPWVTRPGARFWGLGDLDVHELAAVYRHVDSLPSHHAFLLRWQERPVALLQTYAPEHDPVGERYDVATGDVGVHFFLAERGPGAAARWPVVLVLLDAVVLARPGARRVVVEPDVRNAAALARLARLGFTLGVRARVGHKDAQLAFGDVPHLRRVAAQARSRLTDANPRAGE
ncbi:GNAT family N-acetyltransferase [Cellulomonas bogoriensis]|uniref:Lysine N-acyltransferase MbtK n=1 Tax=Cellulomonas bogoriensis 69B4 = DSM 16987 TaxID=1386082 RepID=A0A0A0BY24_9CELL|nr:GNAT family N-acetyltransferase [Cellulomonas bogoriensis]KGM12865.1 siderophore biosynthesis protein [Cellulomonas bogoriensis 69B4 = DSM 16987]